MLRKHSDLDHVAHGANAQSLAENVWPAAYTLVESWGSHKGGPVDSHPDNTKPCVKLYLKTQSTDKFGSWNDILINKVHFPADYVFFHNYNLLDFD